jgi:hypothetical protein
MSTPSIPVPSETAPSAGTFSAIQEFRAALRVPPGRRTPRTWLTEARRLTAADRWLLCMLDEHTALTAFQIQQLGYAGYLTAAVRRLRLLADRQVLYQFTVDNAAPWPAAKLCFTLGPTGAELMAWATAERMPNRADVTEANQRLATSPRTRRSVAANDYFTTLAFHVRAEPDMDLPVWWSPRTCRPLTGRAGHHYGELHHRGRPVGFWYHRDNPDHTPAQAATALKRYQQLLDRTGVGNVVIGTSDHAREARLQEHLATHDWESLTLVTYPGQGHPTTEVYLPVGGAGGRVSIDQLPDTPELDHPYNHIAWDNRPMRLIPSLPPHPLYDPGPAEAASLLTAEPVQLPESA